MVVDEEQEVEEVEAGDGLEPGRSELKDCPELRLCIRRRDTRPARSGATGPGSGCPGTRLSTNLCDPWPCCGSTRRCRTVLGKAGAATTHGGQ